MSEELAGVHEIVSSPRPDCRRSLGNLFRGGAIVAPELLALTLVVTSIVAALAMLSLGGWLIRNDRNHGANRLTARLIEDLHWVQELVVEFFGRARRCRQLLSILATRQSPVMAKELMQRAGADIQSLIVEWAALGIMRLGGLVRFTCDGVLVTHVGREVYQRMSNPPSSPGEHEFRAPSVYDSLFVPVRLDTGDSSYLERVSKGPRRRAPELTHQNRAAAMTGIGQLRAADRGTSSPPKSLNRASTKDAFMKKRAIIMTDGDHEELSEIIRAMDRLSERGRVEMSSLAAELARAEIVDADEIPPDVITMNSRAELLDLGTGERMEFTLVFPIDADIEANKISILAPLGTAMLGYRVGDEFEWVVPYGLRRLRVIAVRFQPEASLAIAA